MRPSRRARDRIETQTSCGRPSGHLQELRRPGAPQKIAQGAAVPIAERIIQPAEVLTASGDGYAGLVRRLIRELREVREAPGSGGEESFVAPPHGGGA